MPQNSPAKTNAQFIREARSVHGNRYGYTKINYERAHSKLAIECHVHGVFQVTANAHLQGSGCPKCNGGVKLTSSEFVSRARKVHGRRYTYGEFAGMRRKIAITCSHGTTSIVATSHLTGAGCPVCKVIVKTQQFIKQSKAVHGDRYDYSRAQFIHCDQKLEIVCVEHGAFWQSPHNHVQKHGCPVCAKRPRTD